MIEERVSRRLRLLSWAGLAVYALFLVSAPFEHHDLACHIKTPLHCTACTGSALGATTRAPIVVGEWALKDAGRAVCVPVLLTETLLAVGSTGRSPPLSA